METLVIKKDILHWLISRLYYQRNAKKVNLDMEQKECLKKCSMPEGKYDQSDRIRKTFYLLTQKYWWKKN